MPHGSRGPLQRTGNETPRQASFTFRHPEHFCTDRQPPLQHCRPHFRRQDTGDWPTGAGRARRRLPHHPDHLVLLLPRGHGRRAARLHRHGARRQCKSRAHPRQCLRVPPRHVGRAHGVVLLGHAPDAAHVRGKRTDHRVCGRLFFALSARHPGCAALAGPELLYFLPGLCQDEHDDRPHRGGPQHYPRSDIHLRPRYGLQRRGARHDLQPGRQCRLDLRLLLRQTHGFAFPQANTCGWTSRNLCPSSCSAFPRSSSK